MFGATYLISGILGAISFGIILDKTKAYIASLRIISILCTILMATLHLCLESRQFWYIMLNIGFLGFFQGSVAVICLPFSIEVTFPMGEAFSNGVLFTSTIFYSSVLAYVDAYLTEISPLYTTATFVGSCVVAMCASVFL